MIRSRTSAAVVVAAIAAGASVVAMAPCRAQTVEVVSVSSSGDLGNDVSMFPDVSDDGSRVVFESDATNLVNDHGTRMHAIFLHNRSLGRTTRLSIDSSGVLANNPSYTPRISGDGSTAVFVSSADNLVSGDTNNVADVFVRDIAPRTTTRVNVSTGGKQANRDSLEPSLSADGSLVVYMSWASTLVSGDTNGVGDIFLRDRGAGTTVRVSVAADGSEANGESYDPSISRDGRFIVFGSGATNLDPADTDTAGDIYLRDNTTGALTLISVDSNGTKGNQGSYHPVVSDDGNLVAFESQASNLVGGDSGSSYDIFVRDVAAGQTWSVCVDSNGNFRAIGESMQPSISGDGRFVFFRSAAADIVIDDENGVDDVDVRDDTAGITSRESRALDRTEGDAASDEPRCQVDGRFVVFRTDADNLVPGVSTAQQVLLRERLLDDAFGQGYGNGYAGSGGVPSLTAPQLPRLNQTAEIDFDNAWSAWTVALVVVGSQPADLPTAWGGELLVLPLVSVIVALPPGGVALTGAIAPDDSLAGLDLYLQVLEIDPTGSGAVAFTPGLELGAGY